MVLVGVRQFFGKPQRPDLSDRPHRKKAVWPADLYRLHYFDGVWSTRYLGQFVRKLGWTSCVLWLLELN